MINSSTIGTLLEKNYLKTKGNIITYSWYAYKELSHKISGHLFESIDYYLTLRDLSETPLDDYIILLPESNPLRIEQCRKAIEYKYKEQYQEILKDKIIFGRPLIVNCNKLIVCDGVLPNTSALLCNSIDLWLCTKDNLWVVSKLKEASFKELNIRYEEEIHSEVIQDYLDKVKELSKEKNFKYTLDKHFIKDINIKYYKNPTTKPKENSYLIYLTGNCRSLGDIAELTDDHIEGVVKDIIGVFVCEFSYKKGYLDIIFAGANEKDQVVIDTIIKRLNEWNFVDTICYKVITEDQLPIKDFHSGFNTYIYTPTPKNWDCSSRLIRECVAYNKKILFTPNSLTRLDANYGLKYLIKKFNLL